MAVNEPSAASSQTVTAATLRQQAGERWAADEREQALGLIGQAIARAPTEVDAYWDRGQWLLALERYDAAIPDLRRVTELRPEYADAWVNLGWSLIFQGDFAAAQPVCARARQLVPEAMAATVNLGHTYLLQGDRAAAHAWYEKTIPLIANEEMLRSGPLADFDLFIARGWQVEASREERAWIEQAWGEHLNPSLVSPCVEALWVFNPNHVSQNR